MGLGGLVTGITGMTGGTPTSSPPKPGKVGQDYLGLIQAYSKGMPTIFDTESKYKPQFTDLDLAGLQSVLPMFTNILKTASPDAAALVRNINPGQTGLLDSMTRTAQQGLDAGTDLDPQLARLFQQSTRGAQAARGMGHGPADVFDESMGLTQLGQTLRQQRQDFAGTVAGLDNQFETGPALNLLTQIPTASESISRGSGPTLIPQSQSYDAFNTAYNARAASNIGNANAQTAMIQGFNSFD